MAVIFTTVCGTVGGVVVGGLTKEVRMDRLTGELVGKTDKNQEYRFDVRQVKHRMCEEEIEGYNPDLITREMIGDGEDGEPIMGKEFKPQKGPLDSFEQRPTSARSRNGAVRWHRFLNNCITRYIISFIGVLMCMVDGVQAYEEKSLIPIITLGKNEELGISGFKQENHRRRVEGLTNSVGAEIPKLNIQTTTLNRVIKKSK